MGLGEFFFVNNIETELDSFMNIQIQSATVFEASRLDCDDKNLIPVGGGKDSIVTLTALSELKERNTCLIINPREASLQSIYEAGYSSDELFEIHRSIDAALLSLNAEGFLNGHTPFSAMLAFNSGLAASLLGCKYIVLSNEASANESTVANTDINHQYSKSIEFERDFNTYFREYISADIYYFSLLRPLSELQIARKFAAQDDRFFSVFKSCNAGSKTDVWCGKCSKCLFVFIILAPFLDLSKLLQIFDANLLDDESLWFTFRQLIGVETVKPFDCVGTVEETKAALSLMLHQETFSDLPVLLARYYQEFPQLMMSPAEIERLLNSFNTDHLVPDSFNKFIIE